jgi:methanogenic corrinoid protein MtbC1
MEYSQIELIEKFEHSLLSMNRLEVRQTLVQESKIKSSIDTIESLVVPTLERIGDLWEKGEVSLSQVYMSGLICEEMVDSFLPPGDPLRTNQPAMAIVVLEDYHMLGKRIVYSTLRASGIELHDYGHMDVDTLIDHVIQDEIKILLISVLMLPSALHIKNIRQKLDQRKYPLKIIVGGAPFRFDQQLWTEVGADAAGITASDAVSLVTHFIEEVE